MRLIDADALYKDVTTSIDYCEDVLEIIDRQPTAEPEYDMIYQQNELTDDDIEELKRQMKTWEVSLSTAKPEDWMERNKERILQAGMEGREIEFRIGGRLFAIREKAQ